MSIKSSIFLFLTLLLMSIVSTAQTGRYDLQFKLNKIDCEQNKVYIDVETRSSETGKSFQIASSNLRMSFNREAVKNPLIVAETGLSGLISQKPIIAYATPNLNGSIDTIISCNILFQLGMSQAGVTISDDWVLVSTISFDIVDIDACMSLAWHTQSTFPATVMSEYVDADESFDGKGDLHDVKQGKYNDFNLCFKEECE